MCSSGHGVGDGRGVTPATARLELALGTWLAVGAVAVDAGDGQAVGSGIEVIRGASSTVNEYLPRCSSSSSAENVTHRTS
jgi:hypothetical protein